ncbi:ras and ef-hand domain-containing protein [Anaeramoeba flamelloides]|uniref:Ras and ef-hand domain-containing protein n=1 Tax=Anaeramoeba flamelloides TaxID=1746091 RepID=A0AAV7ZBW4_9EUKA|nr:ras and ef-hand domain-containing protein [Anaeramoeba flamelloides]
MTSKTPLIKILLIGDGSVGKSCLLQRFVDNTFSFDMIATVGLDFRTETREISGEQVKVQIWDTAGQDNFRKITSNYYRNANGVAIVYDITKKPTFDKVTTWFEEIDQKAPQHIVKIVFGNKIDLENERVIDSKSGEDLAKQYNSKFYEMSALSGVGVNEGLNDLLEQSFIQSKKFQKPKNKNAVSLESGKKQNGGCC